MSKALRISAACCLAALLTSAGGALPGIAGAQTEEGQPAAWILVDGESGVVLDGVNVHEPRPAAGTATLMTALVTVQRLPIAPLDPESVNPVLVSRDATRAPQPRLGISQGARWDVQKLLNGILLSDSNDAAWALAETASGNLAAFAGEMNAFGMQLGLRDSTWTDPLGDDDDTATPNLTSAWDLAVVARAILRVPELKSIVSDPDETINGPQLGKRVVNENDLVHRYLGATGLKQASSDKAGAVLVGSAERDGRSFIVVALGTTGDPVSFGVEKLDAAFDTGASAATKSGVAGEDAAVRPTRIASAQARLEALVNLPPVLGRPALAPGAIGSQAPPTPSTTVPTTQPRQQEAKDSGGGGGGLISLTNFLIALLFSGLVVVIVLRRRAIVMKQRRRVVRQRSFNEAKRRGTIDFIDPDQVAGTSHVKIVRPGERDHRET